MKILHTADWHIGQLFHGYDRTYEHQQFLNWLQETLVSEQIGVLLISGDVFNLSNPSAASVKMFYRFLNQAVKANPDLQIVITAGNHDSAARLESPTPLLESFNIHIIGLVGKKEYGYIDYEKLIIPLKDKDGTINARCLPVGVSTYEIGKDYIKVKFSGTSRTYTYSYRKAGSAHVEQIKQLARTGSGLNSYINRYAKHLYD